MKNFDFPLWSDTAFLGGGVFLVSLCILRYYRLDMWLALLLSVLFALSLAVLFFCVGYMRRRKKLLLRRDREEKEKLMLHLALSSAEENEKLLLDVLRKHLPQREGAEEKLCLLFTMQPLSADAVAKEIKGGTQKNLRIVCNALTPEAARLADSFSIPVTDGNEVYALLKEKSMLPRTYICGEKKKKKFKDRMRLALRKKNSRAFFFGGAGLLALSLFSFFPLYYILGGCTLLLAALFVRIFGQA